MLNGSEFSLVFEDDIWPEEDFIPRLWKLVQEELPCDWHVVSLLSRCAYGTCVSPHLSRVSPDINEPAYRCHAGVNWGMHGILYRTSALKQLQATWKSVV